MLVIGGLIARLVLDQRAQKRALADLESAGSAAAGAAGGAAEMDERPNLSPKPEAADPAPRARIRVIFLLPVLIFAGLAVLFFVGLFRRPLPRALGMIGRAAPAGEPAAARRGLLPRPARNPGFAPADPPARPRRR